MDLVKLFIEGGDLFMTILTIEFILMILAAWKAPAWVKEIGIIALTTGILATFLGLYQAFIAVQLAGSVPMGVMCGGLKVASIPTMYGMIIFLVSLVIRIVQKPRI
ncbi:MAG: hypothetical protein Q8R90_05565 [Bacteroidales bacterium]|jgi:hypothetical protein|nr:hypothetical protein [Bacteroidales bacterium]